MSKIVYVALDLYRGARGHNVLGIYATYDEAKAVIERQVEAPNQEWEWSGSCYYWIGNEEYCFFIQEVVED